VCLSGMAYSPIAPLPQPPQFFEGHLVDGDLKGGGHILQATSGTGANRQTFSYSTDRVVGNGSFGVVFQATCLETGDTVGGHCCEHCAFRSVGCCLPSSPSLPLLF